MGTRNGSSDAVDSHLLVGTHGVDLYISLSPSPYLTLAYSPTPSLLPSYSVCLFHSLPPSLSLSLSPSFSLSLSLFLLLCLPLSLYISPGPVRAQASAPRRASRLPIVVHLPKKSASPGRLCWSWRRAPRGFSARAPGARRLPVFRVSAGKGQMSRLLPNSISCLSRNSMF